MAILTIKSRGVAVSRRSVGRAARVMGERGGGAGVNWCIGVTARSYHGGEMMTMKPVIWWRKPEYPEETTDLRHTGIV